MDAQEAKAFLERERARWFPGRRGISDIELLRRRERLFNGLTTIFALTALVSVFWAGVLGWGVYGWYVSAAGSVVAARQFGVHANRCRDVRQFLDATR